MAKKRAPGPAIQWRMESPSRRETHQSFGAALAAGRELVGYTLEIPGHAVVGKVIDKAERTAIWRIDARGTRYDITVARIN